MPRFRGVTSRVFIGAVFLAALAAAAVTGYAGHGKEGPLVAVMFDDGWLDQYRNALPILLEYDIPATFAVQVEAMGLDRGTRAARMDPKELRELRGLGMEFASHSMTHPNLTRADSLTLIRELEVSRDRLGRMGLEPLIFVYPYGEWNETVAKYVEEAGYAGARTLDPVYVNLSDLNGSPRYWMGGWSITNETAEDVRYIIDSAGQDRLVILVYHHVSDDGPSESTTRVEAFRSHMRLLREGGYRVILLSEVLPQSEDYSAGWLPLAVTSVAVLTVGAIAVDAFRKKGTVV